MGETKGEQCCINQGKDSLMVAQTGLNTVDEYIIMHQLGNLQM